MDQEKSPVTFTLRLPYDLHGDLQQRASAERMSINTLVLRAIDAALANGENTSSPRTASKGVPQ
jgi:predicted HicB family RNase H-like nuclease